MADQKQDEEEGVRAVDLIHPEILSKDTLIDILTERLVLKNHHGNPSLDKAQLVEMFYKAVTPKPQRKYRLNRRGRIMTKAQIRRAKLRAKKTGQQDEQVNMGLKRSASPTEPRLKPPINCVNFQRKTIKLGSSPKSVAAPSEINTAADRLKPPPTSVNPSKVPTTTNSSNGSSKLKPEPVTLTTDPDKKSTAIKLVRSPPTSPTSPIANTGIVKVSSPTSTEPQTSAIESTEQVTEKRKSTDDTEVSSEQDLNQKKFKPSKITWP
ncbi:Hypp157 [Branchiostoma lanceolatum]|uniref:Ashwin n=1 Tax=Branchiostoma lanceolatum TaxID=7740 RepID=A0A8J9VAH1_BRALA|nr:Hypp157 [Branchiostoma lanceolatum]